GQRHSGTEFRLPDRGTFDPDRAKDAHYTDPFDDKRQLVGFAQVGNTELIVMVQQPYDVAVESHTARAVILVVCIGAATFLALLLAGLVARSLARRGTEGVEPSKSNL